jgi:branched-chain amino acid transport system ATP-binding protein
MLKIENLVVAYGSITALHGISLEIPDNRIVCIIGANGAGKSTTINAISGMVRPTSGSITLDGRSLLIPPHRVVGRGIVQVPEGRRIFSSITVRENLVLGGYRLGDPRKLEESILRQYRLFPILGERRHQSAGTLSGGEQQMLAFARGLMSDPKILLLDEPSLGLAPLIVKEIFSLILRLKEQGLTILLVEQNAQKALAIADYAYVLEAGQIVAEGPGASLLGNPVVEEAYLGIKR